jgi:hypothetical protein
MLSIALLQPMIAPNGPGRDLMGAFANSRLPPTWPPWQGAAGAGVEWVLDRAAGGGRRGPEGAKRHPPLSPLFASLSRGTFNSARTSLRHQPLLRQEAAL